MALDRLGTTVVAGAIYALAGTVRRIDGDAILLVLGTDGDNAIRCKAGDIVRVDDTTTGGGGAPTDADYLVKTANGSLSAERVVTDTATVVWDWSAAGQAMAKLAQIPGYSLLGNGSATDPDDVGVVLPDATIVFPSDGVIGRAAIAGDVTIAQGSNTAAITAGVIVSTDLNASFFDTDGTLAANSATRVPAQSAVKTYVDNAVSGLRWKPSVRAATTANITLSGAQTIDGVSVIAGDRVLVRAQSTASANGIYVAASGAWARAADMDTSAEAKAATCFVEEGSLYAETGWVCSTESITLGTTSLVFTQFSGAGSWAAGTGLVLTGNTFSFAAIPGLSLWVNATNGDAVPAVLTASVDKRVFQRNGTALEFGLVDLASSVTGVAGLANGGTGGSTAAAARTALDVARKKSELFGGEWEEFTKVFASGTVATSGAGAGSGQNNTHVTSTENAIGVLSLTTGTTATGFAGWYHTTQTVLLGNGTAWTFSARVATDLSSSGTQEFRNWFGFGDNWTASGEPTDGVYFVYRRDGDGDFWVCCTRSNSSETKTVTAVVPSASVMSIFEIIVNSAGTSVDFKINGTTVATHTTNIPTGAGRQTGVGCKVEKTVGTTALLGYYDWIAYEWERSSAR